MGYLHVGNEGVDLLRWVMKKVTLIAGSICDFSGDVIVNACNPVMLGGGGVDGAIHRAAGGDLKLACGLCPIDQEGIRCPVGQVRPTPAFGLKCKWVFHTAGPIFKIQRNVGPGEAQMGDNNAETLLRGCFRKAGVMAAAMDLKSIAFPAISTGVYGCPQETCAEIAAKWVSKSRLNLDVTFYIFPAEHLGTWIRAMKTAGVDYDAFDQQ